jgi:hypothetical protein
MKAQTGPDRLTPINTDAEQESAEGTETEFMRMLSDLSRSCNRGGGRYKLPGPKLQWLGAVCKGRAFLAVADR